MPTRQRDRAAAIIVSGLKVALIKRDRNRRGMVYYLYPGGGVKEGESLQQAVSREVLEETGFNVTVGKLVAVVTRMGNQQYHFLVTIEGGSFGTGTGPEMVGDYDPAAGTYEAVWMDIDQLLENSVFPTSVSDIVVKSKACGWPNSPIECVDNS